MKDRTIKTLPVPDATELDGAQAWEALVEHFGLDDQPTLPMSLDELPATLELVGTERDTVLRVFGDRS